MQAVFKIKSIEVLGKIYVKYKGGDGMKKKDRREFLEQMLKGAAVGMLSLLPGSLFSGRIKGKLRRGHHGLAYCCRKYLAFQKNILRILKQ